MRIREENCNLVLLAGVTLVSAVIAGGAALLEPASAAGKAKPFYIAAAMASSSAAVASLPSVAAPATSLAPENKPARLADQIPVRVVGAPFVPNTNPRER